MTVRDLACALGMSYMGVKKPCADLAKQGYLKAMRHPVRIGRPELLYRLTEKGHDVFSAQSNDLAIGMLRAARELYGPAAPGKLMYLYLREREKHYAAKIRGQDPRQRAKWFIREREKEGYVCSIEGLEGDGTFRIHERHSPVADAMSEYTETSRMEADMIERLLGASTRLEPQPNASALHHLRTFLITPPPSNSACNPLIKPISCEAHE